MPFNFDLATNVDQSSFYLDGWRSVIYIKYGYYQVSKEIYLLWNLYSTTHVFGVDLKTVTAHHGSNYDEHFKLTLKKFREDLLDWKKTGKPTYMEGYWKEFGDLIIHNIK